MLYKLDNPLLFSLKVGEAQMPTETFDFIVAAVSINKADSEGKTLLYRALEEKKVGIVWSLLHVPFINVDKKPDGGAAEKPFAFALLEAMEEAFKAFSPKVGEACYRRSLQLFKEKTKRKALDAFEKKHKFKLAGVYEGNVSFERLTKGLNWQLPFWVGLLVAFIFIKLAIIKGLLKFSEVTGMPFEWVVNIVGFVITWVLHYIRNILIKYAIVYPIYAIIYLVKAVWGLFNTSPKEKATVVNLDVLDQVKPYLSQTSSTSASSPTESTPIGDLDLDDDDERAMTLTLTEEERKAGEQATITNADNAAEHQKGASKYYYLLLLLVPLLFLFLRRKRKKSLSGAEEESSAP